MFVTRKNEFAKFNVVKMDTGDSPLSSGAIINLIATSVVERNASNVQDYDFFLVFFFYEQRQSRCEVLMVSTSQYNVLIVC